MIIGGSWRRNARGFGDKGDGMGVMTEHYSPIGRAMAVYGTDDSRERTMYTTAAGII